MIVISSEGRYYVASFNNNQRGDCIKVEELGLGINPCSN